MYDFFSQKLHTQFYRNYAQLVSRSFNKRMDYVE